MKKRTGRVVFKTVVQEPAWHSNPVSHEKQELQRAIEHHSQRQFQRGVQEGLQTAIHILGLLTGDKKVTKAMVREWGMAAVEEARRKHLPSSDVSLTLSSVDLLALSSAKKD